ncbi:hexameric tyrosine-coordinated heme protein [Aliikangiella maris]|uniref:Hexameric tyrosine-coordinated heme protein n=2 Tax=Aliikangiella maris TaxID=3162458 RepID=A0ABV3MLW1_9GAMM
MNKLLKQTFVVSILSLSICGISPVSAEAEKDYMPSLITKTPLEGRQLAIKIVRKTIGTIQRDPAAKMKVRNMYAENPQLLMQAAELVNKEFAIIAEANNYWRN